MSFPGKRPNSVCEKDRRVVLYDVRLLMLANIGNERLDSHIPLCREGKMIPDCGELVKIRGCIYIYIFFPPSKVRHEIRGLRLIR